MKTLHLIRHAKSDWADSSLADSERPLTLKGQRSCETMADRIKRAGCGFGHVFCSPAIRAQMTIEAIHAELGSDSFQWTVEPALYTFDSNNLLNWCRQLDDAMQDVVIIGHNPALTDLCNDLTNQTIANMPTAAYAQLALNRERWRQLNAGSAELTTFLTPKMFRHS